MNLASIRWRLPISYVGLALLTAIVLGGVLILTLQSSYSQQELAYLSNSAELMRPGIAKFLEGESSSSALDLYVQNLSFLVQARIQILDRDEQVVADSGSLQAQQFIYTSLSPSGMSADVFREGRAERYLFNVGINILESAPAAEHLGENIAFLSQLPTENTLCGFGVGSGTSKTLQRTEHAVRLSLIASSGQDLGTLLISEGLAFGSKIIDSVVRAWAYASLVAVLVAAASGWWISRRLVAPLSDLTQATERMAAGDLAARVRVLTRDEFGLLGRSFNGMAERVEEMVATLRSFVADAAHELHTPLTTLRVNLDLAADDPGNLGDYMPPAQSQVKRLQALVDSLLDLSRIEVSSGERVRFSLSDLIAELARDYAAQAAEARLEFSLPIPPDAIEIVGEASQIRRALENLLDNALKFTPPGGAITLTTLAEEEGAAVSVADTGIGIPPEDLPRLFRRFHRGRNAANYPGSGLGLAIVKAIVDRHGGRVEVTSDSGGTCVTVSVPALA